MNFVKVYQDRICKDIFKKIDRNSKQLEKNRIIELANKSDAKSVRTQRHWQAAAKVDLYLRENNTLYEQLSELDKQSGWYGNFKIGQDRYRFIKEYPDILNEWRDRNR